MISYTITNNSFVVNLPTSDPTLSAAVSSALVDFVTALQKNLLLAPAPVSGSELVADCSMSSKVTEQTPALVMSEEVPTDLVPSASSSSSSSSCGSETECTSTAFASDEYNLYQGLEACEETSRNLALAGEYCSSQRSQDHSSSSQSGVVSSSSCSYDHCATSTTSTTTSECESLYYGEPGEEQCDQSGGSSRRNMRGLSEQQYQRSALRSLSLWLLSSLCTCKHSPSAPWSSGRRSVSPLAPILPVFQAALACFAALVVTFFSSLWGIRNAPLKSRKGPVPSEGSVSRISSTVLSPASPMSMSMSSSQALVTTSSPALPLRSEQHEPPRSFGRLSSQLKQCLVEALRQPASYVFGWCSSEAWDDLARTLMSKISLSKYYRNPKALRSSSSTSSSRSRKSSNNNNNVKGSNVVALRKANNPPNIVTDDDVELNEDGLSRQLQRTTPLFITNKDWSLRMPISQTFEFTWAVSAPEASQQPFFFYNEFTPSRPFSDFDLRPDSVKMMNLPNAGGTSVESEVMSLEILDRCFGAELAKTEMEIEYWPEGSKKTDYSVNLAGRSIGVSVTRAMKYRGQFVEEDARFLLRKKLYGVIESSKNVLREHKWERQILHVWASHAYIADVMHQEFNKLSSELQHNTIVVVTVSKGNSQWLYFPFA